MSNGVASIPLFAFAQGMLALFPAIVTALVLLAKGTLTGAGVWISLVNSLLAGAVVGLVVGTIYSVLARPAEGSRSFAAILTAFMILLTLGIGIVIPVLTAQHNAALIWKWNP
jgi:hypothetical protein